MKIEVKWLVKTMQLLILLFLMIGCKEVGVDEPAATFLNPKIDSLVEDFTQYLMSSPPLYKGKKVVSVWIKQRTEANYLIVVDNDIPAECENRVGVLYKNGFKVYVLVVSDVQEQNLVRAENIYSKKSKKECQKWVDGYLSSEGDVAFIVEGWVEEGVFDFINDTLYYLGTNYLYDGFQVLNQNEEF